MGSRLLGRHLPTLATSLLCLQGLSWCLFDPKWARKQWVCAMHLCGYRHACGYRCTLTTRPLTPSGQQPHKRAGAESSNSAGLSKKRLYRGTAHHTLTHCSGMGFTIFRAAWPPPQSNLGHFHHLERKSALLGTTPRLPPNLPPAGPPGSAAARMGLSALDSSHEQTHSTRSCARAPSVRTGVHVDAVFPPEAERDVPPYGWPRCVRPSSVRDVGGHPRAGRSASRCCEHLSTSPWVDRCVPSSWSTPGSGTAGSHGPCGSRGCRLISPAAAPANIPPELWVEV